MNYYVKNKKNKFSLYMIVICNIYIMMCNIIRFLEIFRFRIFPSNYNPVIHIFLRPMNK